MSEWTVVTVIVTLGGFIIAIVSPIIKLNAAITRIHTTITALEKDVESLRERNAVCHDRIHDSQDEQDKQLASLKIRLSLLEKSFRP